MPYFDEVFVQKPNGTYQQRVKAQPVDIGYVLQIDALLTNNGIVDGSAWNPAMICNSYKPLMGGTLSLHFEQQRIAEQNRRGTVPILYA